MKHYAVGLLLSLPILSCAQPDPLEVKDAWSRDSVGRVASAAVFMTIRSREPDRLIAASTPVAKKTDLMTMTGGSAAMKMKYLDGIDIPPDRPVSLDPTGLHVWLADLNQPLKAGQTFPLDLRFENAGTRQVQVSVIKSAAAPPSSDM